VLDRADALAAAARVDDARSAYEQAAALARAAGRPRELAEAALGLGGGIAGFEVPFADATHVALLDEALTTLADEAPELRAALLARRSIALDDVLTVEERTAEAEQAIVLARDVGAVEVEIAALAAYCDAIADPARHDERLVAAQRMISLAQQADDIPALLLGHRFAVVARLERGDVVGADRHIAEYAAASARLNRPLYAWYVPLWRGMRALMDGAADVAERYAQETTTVGVEAGSRNAALLAWTLRGAILGPTPRAPELLPEVERLLALFPVANPAMNAGVAGYFAWMGEVDRARLYAERAMVDGRPALRRDSEYLSSLHLLAVAATAVGDRGMATALAEALEPYADVWIVDGIGAACFGVTAFVLGRLCAFLGRDDEAARWLVRAVEAHATAGAVGLRRAAEEELAVLGVGAMAADPDGSPGDAGELRRDGPVWRLRWQGAEVTVRHSKGLVDIATLVATPEREVHVLDLMGSPLVSSGETAPLIDASARTAYRTRLEEIEDDLADAERDGDTAKATRLRTERDFLAAELAAALGIGGRSRPAADPVERARKAVAQRIGHALDAVDAAHPALGRHLRVSLSTGRFCAYRPERRVVWQVEA
jgi:hypothetical protein